MPGRFLYLKNHGRRGFGRAWVARMRICWRASRRRERCRGGFCGHGREEQTQDCRIHPTSVGREEIGRSNGDVWEGQCLFSGWPGRKGPSFTGTACPKDFLNKLVDGYSLQILPGKNPRPWSPYTPLTTIGIRAIRTPLVLSVRFSTGSARLSQASNCQPTQMPDRLCACTGAAGIPGL